MEINYLGHSSFKISNKTKTVVTDPFDPAMLGIKFPKMETVDLVTVSHGHEDHNFTSGLPTETYVIKGPGEYEVGGILVRGISSFHDSSNGTERGKNVIYIITIDDIQICHLGDLGHKLSDSQVEQIGDVDVLLVPVGGTYTLNASEAKDVVLQIEPLVVVPMHYNFPKINQKIFEKLDGVGKFLKEIGAEGVVPQSKFVSSKEKLPETMTVVVLE